MRLAMMTRLFGLRGVVGVETDAVDVDMGVKRSGRWLGANETRKSI
jgi:hypothetical protein